MGSSAGAGSGEFHVYRHLRRKEFARQKQIQHKSRQVYNIYINKTLPARLCCIGYSAKFVFAFLNYTQEELDDAFQQKIDNHRNNAESKTAKKRAKRLKRKQALKNKPKRDKNDAIDDEQPAAESSESSSEEEDEATEEKRAKNTRDSDGEKTLRVEEATSAEEAGETVTNAPDTDNVEREVVDPKNSPNEDTDEDEEESTTVATVADRPENHSTTQE